jgi:hypothetical protein
MWLPLLMRTPLRAAFSQHVDFVAWQGGSKRQVMQRQGDGKLFLELHLTLWIVVDDDIAARRLQFHLRYAWDTREGFLVDFKNSRVCLARRNPHANSSRNFMLDPGLVPFNRNGRAITLTGQFVLVIPDRSRFGRISIGRWSGAFFEDRRIIH